MDLTPDPQLHQHSPALVRVKFKLITMCGDDLEPGDLAQVISVENFPGADAVCLTLLNQKGQAVDLAILRKDVPHCFVVEQGILELDADDAENVVKSNHQQ